MSLHLYTGVVLTPPIPGATEADRRFATADAAKASPELEQRQ
jgi:hypothetical protein